MSSSIAATLDGVVGSFAGKGAARSSLSGTQKASNAGSPGFMALLTALGPNVQAPDQEALGTPTDSSPSSSGSGGLSLPSAAVGGDLAFFLRQSDAMTSGSLPIDLPAEASPEDPESDRDQGGLQAGPESMVVGLSALMADSSLPPVPMQWHQELRPAETQPAEPDGSTSVLTAPQLSPSSPVADLGPASPWKADKPSGTTSLADSQRTDLTRGQQSFQALKPANDLSSVTMKTPNKIEGQDTVAARVESELDHLLPTVRQGSSALDPFLARAPGVAESISVAIPATKAVMAEVENAIKPSWTTTSPDPQRTDLTRGQQSFQALKPANDLSSVTMKTPNKIEGQDTVAARVESELDHLLPTVRQGSSALDPFLARAPGGAESISVAMPAADSILPSAEKVSPMTIGHRASAEARLSGEPSGIFQALELAPKDLLFSDRQSDGQGHPKEKSTQAETAGALKSPEPFGFQAIGAPEPRYEPIAPSMVMAPDSPEAAIAETVTYWASQGIQNAELKLDAWGGEALEVSISIHGNQAEVEFRTDQSDIRQVIEAAMPQLRDMLAGEGLELSGAAVGSSGGQSADSSGRRPPQDSRLIRLSQVDEEVSTIQRRPVSGIGRSLDLFV